MTMQAGERLAINAAHLRIAPAGRIKTRGIHRRELEGDGARYREGFPAFRQLLFETFVEIVVIRMELVLERIKRMVVVQVNRRRHRPRPKAATRHGDGFLEGKGGRTQPAPGNFSRTNQGRDEGFI